MKWKVTGEHNPASIQLVKPSQHEVVVFREVLDRLSAHKPDQMAHWIDLLIIDSGFADESKSVPCLYCAGKGEENFLMKKKKDRFECPRCGESLWQAGQLSRFSTVYLVKERLKRGEKPPD